MTLDPEIKEARAREKLKIENSRLRALNKKLISGNSMNVEYSIDLLKEWLIDNPVGLEYIPSKYPQSRPVPLSPALFGAKHSEVATLVLSDWHLAENIRPQDTNGINVYNSVVAANRVWETVDDFKRIVIAHQNMYPFEKIHVLVLGDMISGDIHSELALTNDLLPVPSTVLAGQMLIMALLEILTLGIPVEVDCIVGNHGRTVETMPTKQQAHMSYDWMVYVLAESYFHAHQGITFNIHTGQFGAVNLFGHRAVIEHGYGAKRPEDLETRIRNIFDNPIYRQNTGLTGSSVDLIVIGDRHRDSVANRTMVNGALSGAGELGMSWRLSPIPAGQQCFGSSRRHPITWHYFINTTHVLSCKRDNLMSDFASDFLNKHGRNN